MSTKQLEKHTDQTGTRTEYRQSKRRNLQEEQNPVHTTSKHSRRQAKRKRKQEKLAGKKARRRIFPIWLRIIVVLLLSVVALLVGLMVGYGILGDGVPSDALKWETWQHIIDIVKKQ